MRIQLSLAATMFFAPLVKHLLKKWHLNISEQDKKFIEGYLRLGYLTIWVLLLTIASSIVFYFAPGVVFMWISRISIVLLLIFLCIGSLWAVADVSILQEEWINLKYYENKTDKSDIILSYFPVYNIFQRYKLHDFEHPYWRAKESILMRTIFLVVIFVTKSSILGGLILTIIIIRLASLLADVDVIQPAIKQKLSHLFIENPEEMRAYITGTITFWIRKIQWQTDVDSLHQIIDIAKKEYQHVHKIQNKNIIGQYIVGLILLSLWVIIGDTSSKSRVIIFPILLIIWRYGVMVRKRKHLPPLPLANEIFTILKYWYQKAKIKLQPILDKITDR